MKPQATRTMKQNFIFLLAGLMFGGVLSMVSISLAEGDTWTKKADMPTGRVDLSSAVVNGKVYVIGGSAINCGPALSAVEEYNPATDIWTKKADMLTARAALSSVAVKGEIYASEDAKTISDSPAFQP